jgi:hypothetical protein
MWHQHDKGKSLRSEVLDFLDAIYNAQEQFVWKEQYQHKH